MMDKMYSDESDDGDIFSNQNQTQIQSIRIQGPNVSNFNISKLPICNNQRPRYEKSLYNQRNYIREKRDTSPMSVYSTLSLPHQNFQHSVYHSAMPSQRSMLNGKFGSSMSVQSFGSNVTFSAVDIAQAIKNHTFNERDMTIIGNAYIKYKKKRNLKRVEKRRKKRLLRYKKKNSVDSGDPSGESSDSSDGARSVRTCRTVFSDNNSSSSCKSARTDCIDFRRTMQSTNLYKDCTQNFKQHAFRSRISSAPKYDRQNVNHQKPSTAVQRLHYPLMSQTERFGSGFLLPSQKLDPSLTSSIIPEHPHKQSFVENCSRERSSSKNFTKNCQLESDSESEEIFIGFKSKRNFNHIDDENNCLPQKKRNKLSSPQKRIDTNERSQKQNVPKTDRKICDFVFAKPQLPIRKPVVIKKSLKPVQSNEKSKQNYESSQPAKKNASQSNQIPANESTMKTSNTVEKAISKSSPPKIFISPEKQPAEKLIAKSSQPLDDVMVSNPKQILKILHTNSPQDKDHIEQSEDTQLSTTDISMRPSFIKRKLFTQKADIAENRNASSDTIEENSPQSNMYSMIQKEKNRTRKLVTSQSCLNRELGDESNLLELIHKIVPANQMNLTTTTNRTDIRSNKPKPENSPGEKWDVSLALTQCNKNEESDTYTDEEIFNTNETVYKSKANNTHTARTEKEKPNKRVNKLKSPITQVKLPEENQNTRNNKLNPVSSTARTEREKANQIANKLKPPITQVKSPEENQDIHTIRALKCIKSFWSSDVESDEETVKNSEAMLSSIKNCYELNPVSATSDDLRAKNNNCKAMTEARKHIKTTNGASRIVTTSASSNAKQKKPSKDKSLSKSPPQKKQVQNTKTKILVKSQKLAATENKTVPNRALQKVQEKVKVKKNVTTNANNSELNNTKVASSNREAIFTFEKDTYQKVVNKTLTIRLFRQQPCCDIPPKNTALNDTKLLTRSLRNREIDLSTTASSGLDTTLKDVMKVRRRNRQNEGNTNTVENKETTLKSLSKRRGRPRKNEGNTKSVENKENVSNLSDLSFTLQLDKTIMTRRMKSKLNNNGVLIDNRKRPNDVSFSLVTDCKKLNKTGMTTRSADRSRN